MKRVVITGLGAVTPIGIGKDEYLNSLLKGNSGIDYIPSSDTENYDTKIGAEVKDFSPQDFMDKKESKRLDRFIQYAVAGTSLALEDGQINLEKLDKDRIGVILGSGIGGMETLEKEHTKLLGRGESLFYSYDDI